MPYDDVVKLGDADTSSLEQVAHNVGGWDGGDIKLEVEHSGEDLGYVHYWGLHVNFLFVVVM